MALRAACRAPLWRLGQAPLIPKVSYPLRSYQQLAAFKSRLLPRSSTRSLSSSISRLNDGLRNNRDHSGHQSFMAEVDVELLRKLPPEPEGRERVPSYALVFTCKKCSTRSAHRITKQGYKHGTVLIKCPGCKNRHLIADNLKIFSDTTVNLETIMKEKGEMIQKLSLTKEGDLEFWDPQDTKKLEAWQETQDGKDIKDSV
ncbi:zf-DNL-domain-containing protein [Microthyrium microscopicum]|uniref:Zf-DNL-domain-containing protein n=1 Tax=Microthyrium microscopicum TaxID=703497 RepID=A0A6A6UHF8_9PEZI|nr:zf-DNL-domain-containing protein [Microthyrium microscopicum]